MARRLVIPLFIALGLTAWGLSSFFARRAAEQAKQPKPVVPIALSGPTMGSTWTVRIPRPPADVPATQLQAGVQSILDTVERQMSTYKPDSTLSRFNQSRSTDWFPIPADLALVLHESNVVSQQTGGAFDVTVGPLVNLWGFGPTTGAATTGVLPTEQRIDELRRHVSYRLLELRDKPLAVRKTDPQVYVDLSGIAKGHAADLVGEQLEAAGVHDYLVGIGGEMRARGLSEKGKPWRVGIETPTPGIRRVLFEIELQNFSLSTSGDYRNFFDQGTTRYCHEIDPTTGRPADHAPASVSVVHSSGMYADAIATALMVLGPEKGLALAKQLHLAVLFVTRSENRFEPHATPEFQKMLLPEGSGK